MPFASRNIGWHLFFLPPHLNTKQSLAETTLLYMYLVNPPELIAFQNFPLFSGTFLKFEMTQTAKLGNLRHTKKHFYE